MTETGRRMRERQIRLPQVRHFAVDLKMLFDRLRVGSDLPADAVANWVELRHSYDHLPKVIVFVHSEKFPQLADGESTEIEPILSRERVLTDVLAGYSVEEIEQALAKRKEV